MNSFTYSQLESVRLQTIARIRQIAGNRTIVVSHITALQLLRVELPHPCPLDKTDIHFTSMVKGRRRVNPHVIPHSSSREVPVVNIAEQIWCIAPVYVWIQMARYLNIKALVVLGDAMMRRKRKLRLACIQDFIDALTWLGPRYPYRVKCLAAVRMMRPGTDSSPESELRVSLWRVGLGGLSVNHVIRDANSRWLPDIAYVKYKVIVEYDGEYHFGKIQVKADTHRRQRLRRLGWTVITAYASDLVDLDCDSPLVADIIAELERASGKRVMVHRPFSDRELMASADVDVLVLKRKYHKRASTRRLKKP